MSDELHSGPESPLDQVGEPSRAKMPQQEPETRQDDGDTRAPVSQPGEPTHMEAEEGAPLEPEVPQPSEQVATASDASEEPADQVAAGSSPGDIAVAEEGEIPGQAETRDEAAHGAAADRAVLTESGRRTRRAFVVGTAAVAAGFGFYKWIDLQGKSEMQPALLRGAFEANATLSEAVGRNEALAPTYSIGRAETLRVNGVYGLKMELVPESWRLQLVGVRKAAERQGYVEDVTAWEYLYAPAKVGQDQGHDTKVDPALLTAQKMASSEAMKRAIEDESRSGRKPRRPRGTEEAGESRSTLAPGTPGLLLTMDRLLKLPRHELVTQFKCIEGWSQVVHWAGVRLADLLEAYPPESINGREPKYVYMETPDGDYYTGYNLSDCRHPQSLLVTEMMGAPLTQFHGAPLRLHMPTKYGYKQIKRIGLISYTDSKPDDYWTKLGYDWYAGL